MSFKQWTAVILLAIELVIVAWLVWDTALHPMPGASAAAVATRLLWVGLVMILLNIGTVIVMAIVGSIVTRKEFKDEASDERDKAVYAKSMRNAYFVASIGGVATLLLFAFGFDPVIGVYAVFAGGMVAGAAGALSQLYYYRLG
jgi:cytochrome c oxidase assembly factor CtaG